MLDFNSFNLKNNYILFTVLILISLIIAYIFNSLININTLIYNSYSEQLAQEQVDKLFEVHKKWKWISYAIIPILILIRSSLVTLSLSIGMFFYDTENKIKLKQIFRITLFGEFVLLLVSVFKIFYFTFIKKEYNLEDLQQFYPLSYINILDIKNIDPWLIYPLQTINFFEVGYFFVLVFGLHKLLKSKFSKSFEIVTISYGTGLIIWLGLVTFLTLNIT